jgi:hypothetical protein
MYTIDQSCIGRIGQDHFIARLQYREQHVEDPRQSAGRHDAFGVGAACALHAFDGGLPQRTLASERQVVV